MARPEEQMDQSQLLEEAFGFAAEQRFHLRKAIQDNDIERALRCGLCLANELRVTRLLPENYYKLYMLVFWELQQLAEYVASEEHGLSLENIYQIVQHEGSILPRLYVLVTIGAVCIRQDAPSAAAVIADLGALLSAVQHPVRGLFLRYFLLQMTKDKLLERLDVRGTLEFLLANFAESASLWVRLLNIRVSVGGSVGGDDQDDIWVGDAVSCNEVWHLDRFRCSLRLLVGAHLIHLARLPSLTVDLYEEIVLPEVSRRSTACEDASGKAYLLDCFVQVFPDRYHLATLAKVLATCAEVHWYCDLRPLLQHLMKRLTLHLQQDPETSQLGLGVDYHQDIFSLFHVHLQVLHQRPKGVATPLASLLELQLELLLLTLALHPDDADRVDLVLKGTVDLLAGYTPADLDTKSIESVVNLLAAPLTHETLVPSVLALPHHTALIGVLDCGCHQEAAVAMVSALLAGDVALCDSSTLERLFLLIDPMIHDERSGFAGGVHGEGHHDFDPVAFAAEQEKVAKLMHQVRHSDPAEVFKMLVVAKRYFCEGGPHRVVYTLPSTVVATLRLVKPFVEQRKQSSTARAKVLLNELFDFVHDTYVSVGALRPEESLPVWLLCATTANRADEAMGESKSACAKFVDCALKCLENDIKSEKAQFRGLSLIAGTLFEIRCLETDVYLSAADRAVSCGARLTAKSDQSRAHCFCSNLFWSPTCQEPQRVLTCLRRAMRLADAAIHNDPLEIVLFVEVLEQAVRLFEDGTEAIKPSFLAGLLTLCSHHLRYIEGRAPEEARRSLASAAAHLQSKASDPRFHHFQTQLHQLSILSILN